jgi:hypothetical protein
MSESIVEHEDPRHGRVLEEFVSVITRLCGANRAFRNSVGQGVSIANSLFAQRFGSVEEFQGSPEQRKSSYIRSLAGAERHFNKRWPTMAIGFCLFRLWLEALLEEDEALVQNLWKGLVVLGAGSGGNMSLPRTRAERPGVGAQPAVLCV